MAGIVALAAAYIFSQFYRSFLAVLTPVLSEELGATKADLSQASGMWFLTFALMQFIVGVSLDRFGPRRTAAVLFAFGSGGGALLFASANTPSTITIAMGMIGIGCSPVLMASLFIFAHRFAAARFAVLSSWLMALGTAGNVIGARPLVLAIEMAGWRTTMLTLAIISLAVAVAIVFIVKDPPGQESDGSSFGGYLQLLKMPAMWLVGPLMAVSYAPAAGIRGLWIGPYLSDVYGVSPDVLGNVALFMAVSMIIGAFIYGPLDTLLNTRKWVGFFGNLVLTLALLALFAWPVLPVLQASLLMIVIGLFGSSYGLIMAHGRAFCPPSLVGRGVTLLNFFSIGGVGLIQVLTGRVADSTFDPAAPERAFSLVFATYAVLMLIALVIYLFSQDKPPREAVG